jgi:hypothetical protein
VAGQRGPVIQAERQPGLVDHLRAEGIVSLFVTSIRS